MEPRLIADYECVCGEGPMWHPDEKRLYWIDIPRGRLFRYDPATSQHEMCFETGEIGGFTIQTDGSLLLFMARCAVKTWRGGKWTTIIEEVPEECETRFNDVIADPAGRVFCGTMSSPNRYGRLYRLDRDGALTEVAGDMGTPNGLGFTPDRKAMYHTDSRAHSIYLYDYDAVSGAISNRRVFIKTPDDEGVPDGMTVDAEGCVWTAKWNGGCLVRYRPDATEERRIAFPAQKVSCVTFGGDDYTDMYITTAGGGNKPEEGPGAGGLFHMNLGIQGVPEFRSRIGL
ncbi:MAG: SMP-30/gluconolactonase/LRE family protein [Nitrospiraceae bacterium]|nr:SMP-30/gluconolactonase/LRE family protein [Nitrospiraceae bacterium]